MSKPKLLIVSRSTVLQHKAGGLETQLENLITYLKDYYDLTVLTTLVSDFSVFDKYTEDTRAYYTEKKDVNYIFLKNTVPGEYGYGWYENLLWQIPIKRNFNATNTSFRKIAAEYYSKKLKGEYKVILSQSSSAQDFKISKEKLIIINHGTTINEIMSRVHTLGTIKSPSFLKNLFRFILLDLPMLLYEFLINNPQLFSKSTKIILISTRLKKDFLTQHSKFANKVRVIPNGIDTKKFKPSVKNKKFTVLYFGRINKEKGIYTFLEVSKRLPEAYFQIFGDGPDRQYLESQLSKIFYNNVEYKGAVTNAEISRILSKSHVFLFLTKRKEGMPMSILESLSSGCAVVTTLSDSTLSESNSYYYVEDIEHSVSCIQKLMKTSFTEHRDRARETALKNFSLDTMGKQYRIVINKYLKQK